ncbi:MAG: hypothetical protein Q8S04_06735 [Bacteroidales bacterium]|nr:hypothetical protein [Bacteroidales bacterium]
MTIRGSSRVKKRSKNILYNKKRLPDQGSLFFYILSLLMGGKLTGGNAVFSNAFFFEFFGASGTPPYGC